MKMTQPQSACDLEGCAAGSYRRFVVVIRGLCATKSDCNTEVNLRHYTALAMEVNLTEVLENPRYRDSGL